MFPSVSSAGSPTSSGEQGKGFGRGCRLSCAAISEEDVGVDDDEDEVVVRVCGADNNDTLDVSPLRFVNESQMREFEFEINRWRKG